MNAVSVYVNTAKLVLQSTESAANANAALHSTNPDLPRLLVSLRQLLTCVVCSRLVNDPYCPQHGKCMHNVCRLCMRGQKILQPACNYCKDSKDLKSYDENKQMRCLMMCYKSLCEHLKCSQLFGQLASYKQQMSAINNAASSVMIPQMSLQDLIVEGASYDEVLASFSNDLPKQMVMQQKTVQVPALVTTLASSSVAPLAPLQPTIKITGGLRHTTVKTSTPTAGSLGGGGALTIPVSNFAHKLKVEQLPSLPFKLQHYTSTSSPSSTASTPSTPHSSLATVTATTTSTTTHPQLVNFNQLKNAGNITYIGPNTRGIVLPMVSSSGGTTTVPLSIASARLQTLNRQLVQARAFAVSSASSSSTSSSSTSATNTSIATSTEQRPPLTAFKVSLASSPPLKTVPTFTCSLPAATSSVSAATSQIRNPPAIKTVSNGSAMYSVLYTGIGNKITIKRKTDGDEDATQKKNASTSAPTNTNLLRPLAKTLNKKRGCRCGNTTATPGKLTCCGQRCPCYVDSKSCIGCKCRGCRNPHRPDGNKVRPVIPELACYEIQMADDHANMNEMPIATTSNVLNNSNSGYCNNNNNNNNVTNTNLSTLNFNAGTTATSTASVVTSTSNATLIPIRGLHHLVANSSSSSSCSTSTTLTPITAHTMPTQTTSMTQASLGPLSASASSSSSSATSLRPGNVVQLDQIQRESLLIQNAEGKFQFVNVFTTGGVGSLSNNQVPTLQRIQNMPQTIVSGHNSFILPSSISTTSMSGTTTTTSLPQIILQSQQQKQQVLHHHQQQQQHQQHHQQQQQHQSQTTQRIPNNVTTKSLPLQLQQQLKQNIITVHTINANSAANTSPAPASVLTPSSSPAPTTATLTLPPVIMTNDPQHETTTTTMKLGDSSLMSRNTYTNIIVSSAASSLSSSSSTVNTSSSTISLPLSVSLAGTLHTQSFNRKTLNSPNV